MTFALCVFIPQILEIVHSANTDPNTVPDGGHAGFLEGDGTASGLERWHAEGLFEDRRNVKAQLLTGFLIAIFFSLSVVLIVLMRWGCSKTSDENCKEQEELTTCPECLAHSAPADDPASWKVAIPHSTSIKSDVFAVHIPTLSKESLRFPSNLTIGVYTGFTTGVGPRR